MIVDLSAPGSQAALGEIVGVSQQAISASGIQTGPLGQMVLAYCRRLREMAAGRASDGPLDLVQERAALAREQRLGIEMKNAVLRGEYASIALLAEVLAAASQSVVERFEQLPGLLKRSCPQLDDAARDQVMTALAAARNEWVRATAALVAATLETTDDAEPELDGMDDEPRTD